MAIVRITAAEFVTSAASARDLLQTSLPELAIAGRSNVGKSTLINVLAGRTLARTSAAPGKTRLANYYRLQPSRGPAFHLVDLPGYGYARGARDGQAFDTLAREYFFGDVQGAWIRPAIAGVILLVDARHPGRGSDASDGSARRDAHCAWWPRRPTSCRAPSGSGHRTHSRGRLDQTR
jgi:GTP-binding protein